MYVKATIKPWLLCIFMLMTGVLRAQQNGVLRGQLQRLLLQYQQHRLTDTAYLKGVDSIAPRLVKDDSLKADLAVYRQIAFDNPALGAYRGSYYTYLAFYTYNRNEFGSSIYYAEKDMEEKVKAGIFEKGGIPRSQMFAITVYYNNKDYARVFAKYATLRPALMGIPRLIEKDSASPNQVYLAFGILNSVVYSSFNKKDTSRTGECIDLCARMLEEVDKRPAKYKSLEVVYRFIYHELCYAREKYLDHYEAARDLLELAIREVKGFPPDWQPAYTEELYSEAEGFFFDHHRLDSAQRYLDLIHSSSDTLVSYSSMNQRFFLDATSKLLASRGNYAEAYKDMRKVYDMSDSSFYAVSADRDNNLYALAEAENTRNELLRTEAKKEAAEHWSELLFSLLALVLFAGVISFMLYRSRQQRRLLNLQLSLARNFHDEIGPMLLYASTLVKKESEEKPSPRLEELKGQIHHVMEAVRGISHDLKSTELSTVDTFYKELRILLEKVRSTTQIAYELTVNSGEGILSHLQLTHLRKMVNELVTNSIKHAGCDLILVDLQVSPRRLRIRYSDNGKGMEAGAGAEGIGLQNLRERAGLLNGAFQLHNSWPEGYYVDISVPLV